ncbi:hypothetical protein C1645_835391 [Glomus cerebriforme]|uniref:HMG box domain-containing protein n=1 Tax=Glomus cerebriforme TaxID=658196 RepID=A0A397S8X3_9GLOM|nr:hypothetical protein C1645_835391 [Glomus cerebriforme]
MSDNDLYVIQHTFQSETPPPPSNEKKRSPTCFILFRQEMLKEKPPKMTMAQYSKLVSEKWQNLSEAERIRWKRLYEINRDYRPEPTVENSPSSSFIQNASNSTINSPAVNEFESCYDYFYCNICGFISGEPRDCKYCPSSILSRSFSFN